MHECKASLININTININLSEAVPWMHSSLSAPFWYFLHTLQRVKWGYQVFLQVIYRFLSPQNNIPSCLWNIKQYGCMEETRAASVRHPRYCHMDLEEAFMFFVSVKDETQSDCKVIAIHLCIITNIYVFGLSICLSVCLSIHLSVCTSVRPNISRAPPGNFFNFSTTLHLNSVMNWLDCGGSRSKVKVTVTHKPRFWPSLKNSFT